MPSYAQNNTVHVQIFMVLLRTSVSAVYQQTDCYSVHQNRLWSAVT